MSGELLISLDEAARRLALCRRTVQELTYQGQLPSLKIGRARRIAVVDLETFAERLRQENGVPLAIAERRP
jgi:excisionase family DNA binding protein